MLQGRRLGLSDEKQGIGPDGRFRSLSSPATPMTGKSRRKALPEGFVALEDGSAQCQICNSNMLYGSVRNHCNTQGHQFRAANVAAAERRAQQEESSYGALFEQSGEQVLAYMPVPLADTQHPPDVTMTEAGLPVDADAELRAYASAYLGAHTAPDPHEYLQRQADGVEQLTVDLALLYLHDDLTSGMDDATISEQAGYDAHVDDGLFTPP